MIGKTLGHYRITAKIGSGGMGEVYRARDERLERDVAVKVLPVGTLADEDARKRFRREGETLSKLNHPHIATVHDFDTQDGVDFLVMEYVPGETLKEKLSGGPLPEKDVTRLGLQIAEALEAAHRKGVVHRDLKPGNIAFTETGDAKVLDFGIAKLLRSQEEDAEAPTVDTLTKTVGRAGTLPYMAPEQLRGEEVDTRTDIYALGATLYEIATGRRPFEGSTAEVLIGDIQHKAPRPPTELNRRVSAKLEDIILKCLEKDPANRYQHADELAVDLRRLATPTAAGASRELPGGSARWITWGLGVGLGAVALLAVLIGLNVGGLRDRLVGSVAPGEITSIAVLPLDNMMGDAEQDYFVAGMHEALIMELSKISALKVISRTSTLGYKDTDKSIPEIARELGVDAVIEGSVLRAEDTVRITAQLIDGRTDRHLWANNFDRELKDILALHSDVARAIAREIRVAVTPEEESRLAAARPVNPEVYQLYLKGNFQMGKLTEEGFGKALKNFQEAIEKAPDYAPAYAGAGLAYLGLGSWHTAISPKTVHEKAKQSALKALELDDALGDAYIVLGRIKHLHEWDWTGADRLFKQGIELNPGFTFGRILYANYLTAMGRFEESIESGKRTVEFDPLSPMAYNELGWALQHAGRYDEALEQVQKGLELNPDFPQSNALLAFFYSERGMTKETMVHLPRIESLLGHDIAPSYLSQIGGMYGKAGRKADAMSILEELEERATKEFVPATAIADVYLGLGETEKALNFLEKAYEDRDINLVWLKVFRIYDPLRDEPRFQSLLRRMNFPEN